MLRGCAPLLANIRTEHGGPHIAILWSWDPAERTESACTESVLWAVGWRSPRLGIHCIGWGNGHSVPCSYPRVTGDSSGWPNALYRVVHLWVSVAFVCFFRCPWMLRGLHMASMVAGSTGED